jgi:hypothetical protein
MNEEEWVDRVGGDGTDDRGDRGGVQPTSPDTSAPDAYRGPYGEPIVIPHTDDPEADDDLDADELVRAINAITQDNNDRPRPIVIPYAPGSIFDPNRIREYAVAHDWESDLDAFLTRYGNGSDR